ncbi:HPr family phosphocarrier protein [Bradyrhizobium jicamae]|uniref:HPr family phosphocarrier protein n=1 Tax=Bradyrhizobium jicamae TaxID=280332 RepID=UPI002011C97D|nr:HPr family phosphocarrier protein [Bradyrhizobium jicamae]
MLDKADGQIFSGNVRLIHAVGMHARPAVKLTKLAKKFQAQISVRVEGAAEWINAKSVAKIMAMRAAHGSTIEIKASGGSDAEAAVAALVKLIETDFPDEVS